MKKLAADALEVFVVAMAAALGLAVAVGIVMGVFVLASKGAKAEGADYRDGRWARGNFCRVYAWDGVTCLRRRHQPSPYRQVYREPDPIRYYAAPRYDDARDDERRSTCRDIRRAVGDQHLTVDGAKKAANDGWAGAVRFHHGEKFMDLSNARNIVYTCSRSSIKEAGSSVTALGAALTRCEIEAQPCAPITEPIAREER